MTRGGRPTARTAHAGEFTPPGMTFCARSKSCELSMTAGTSVNMARVFRRRRIVGARLAPAFSGPAFFAGRQGPEEAVRHHVAHARPESGVERLVEEGQRLADRSLQFGARREQRGERGRQRVAGADEADLEALELLAGDRALR